MSNTDPGLGRLSAPSLPSVVPPAMTNGASGTQLDHESRIGRTESDVAQIKRIVGWPPFLDDPGAGMARGIAEIHGTVTKSERLLKWGLAIMAGALLASEAVRYAARVTVSPAMAAPVIVQPVVVQPPPAGPTH